MTFKKAFDTIDTDGSNTVSLPELRAHIVKLAAGELPGSVGEDAEDTSENGRTGGASQAAMKRTVIFGADIQTSKLDEEVYDVANFYWEDGCSQAIARSEIFINVTLAVISLNAMYLGVDADNNTAENLLEAPWGFIACEYAFCIFFLFEWTVRFLAFESKNNCLKDGWFKFDTLLMFLMITETWILPSILPVIAQDSAPPPTAPLRLLRLLRLSRLVRLIRQLPELVVIIKGMLYSIRAVASSLIMACILIYVFAILEHMLLKDEEVVEGHFSTLPLCMWTLLMDGLLLMNTSTTLGHIVHQGKFHTTAAVMVFLLFILIAGYTVMNMLIGVILEVVSAVSENQKDESDIKLMKQTILLELKKHDDGDGMIDEEEMMDLMADPATVETLTSLGIDVPFLQMLQVMSYSTPDASFPIEVLIEQMLTCRSALSFTVKHMVIQTKLANWNLTSNLERLEAHVEKQMDTRLSKLSGELRASLRRLSAPVPAQSPPDQSLSQPASQKILSRPSSGMSFRGRLVQSNPPPSQQLTFQSQGDKAIYPTRPRSAKGGVPIVRGRMVIAQPTHVIDIEGGEFEHL